MNYVKIASLSWYLFKKTFPSPTAKLGVRAPKLYFRGRGGWLLQAKNVSLQPMYNNYILTWTQRNLFSSISHHQTTTIIRTAFFIMVLLNSKDCLSFYLFSLFQKLVGKVQTHSQPELEAVEGTTRTFQLRISDNKALSALLYTWFKPCTYTASSTLNAQN